MILDWPTPGHVPKTPAKHYSSQGCTAVMLAHHGWCSGCAGLGAACAAAPHRYFHTQHHHPSNPAAPPAWGAHLATLLSPLLHHMWLPAEDKCSCLGCFIFLLFLPPAPLWVECMRADVCRHRKAGQCSTINRASRGQLALP